MTTAAEKALTARLTAVASDDLVREVCHRTCREIIRAVLTTDEGAVALAAALLSVGWTCTPPAPKEEPTDNSCQSTTRTTRTPRKTRAKACAAKRRTPQRKGGGK